jgi:hypothetical protein
MAGASSVTAPSSAVQLVWSTFGSTSGATKGAKSELRASRWVEAQEVWA